MKYTIDRKESYTIIQLQEKQLNSVIAPELKTALILMGNEGVKNIILDINLITKPAYQTRGSRDKLIKDGR